MREWLRAAGLEAAGLAVLEVVAALWLHIPDSHGWEFCLSVMIALAWTVGFLVLHAVVIRKLRGEPRIALWRGAGLLALWLGIWCVLVMLLHAVNAHAVERAGYWNARLGPHPRATFTYGRLLSWQIDAIAVMFWLVLPGILIPLVVETVTRGVRGGALATGVRVYRRWQWWLAVAAAAWVGRWIAEKMIAWHPAYSVRGEVVSAVLRIGSVYLVAVGLGAGVLRVAAELGRRASFDGRKDSTPQRPESAGEL